MFKYFENLELIFRSFVEFRPIKIKTIKRGSPKPTQVYKDEKRDKVVKFREQPSLHGKYLMNVRAKCIIEFNVWHLMY